MPAAVARQFRSGATLILAAAILSLATIARGASPPADKVAPALAARLARGEQPAALVLFRRRADLSAPARVNDWAARGRAVVEALQSAAADQRGAQELARRRGAAVQSFFAVNAMRVVADRATIDALAALPEVEAIREERVFAIPTPQAGAELP